MAARLKFGRSLLVAGVLTAVAVPAMAGAAYAGGPPQPDNTPSHQAAHATPATTAATHAAHAAHNAHNVNTAHNVHPVHNVHNVHAVHNAHNVHAAHNAHNAHAAHNPYTKPAKHGARAARVTSAHRPTTTLMTVVPDANIRSKTTTAKRSHVIATLHTRGEKVQVVCHKIGMSIGGDTTWYKTVTPARGYIAAAMVDHPTTAIPLCTKKP